MRNTAAIDDYVNYQLKMHCAVFMGKKSSYIKSVSAEKMESTLFISAEPL